MTTVEMCPNLVTVLGVCIGAVYVGVSVSEDL